MAALPVIMDAFGLELSDMASTLPKGLLEQIGASGLLEGLEPESETPEEPGGGGGPR
jgi:hypothetical protein